MKWLLRVREVFKSFYGTYSPYIDGLVKFAVSMAVYMTVIYHTGYNTAVSNPFIAVILGLISAFLPVSAISVITAALLMAEFISVSLELTALTAVMFVFMMLLYFIFKAGDSILMPLVMTVCLWNMSPLVLPIALLINPAQVIVVAFGVLVYGIIIVVRRDLSALAAATSSMSMGGRINLVLSDLFSNTRFLLILAALVLTVLIVTMFKRSKANYAGLVGFVVGNLIYLILFIFGSYILNITFSPVSFAAGFVLGILAGFVILFGVQALDYNRCEEVSFEDDEYCYFVKAVPKASISAAKKTEEIITSVGQDTINVQNLFIRHDEKEGGGR
ncbi:MAG: hypothetical protein J6Z23_04015 [Lachnospiraceae bacterium]|nr:hypothetical protein [Lachnospiraceae bacterium]MBP5254531.1 hypothetical protein [Lachnospiraceae bacterium]